jgi:hypothetical protein
MIKKPLSVRFPLMCQADRMAGLMAGESWRPVDISGETGRNAVDLIVEGRPAFRLNSG